MKYFSLLVIAMSKESILTLPINITKIIIIFPAGESTGVKFKLKPTVEYAENVSKARLNKSLSFSVIINKKIAIPFTSKESAIIAKALRKELSLTSRR